MKIITQNLEIIYVSGAGVLLRGNMIIDSWKCDICHEERPDAKISVLSKPIPYGQHNIKYCNDREGCKYGAENLDLFSGTEEEEEIENDN